MKGKRKRKAQADKRTRKREQYKQGGKGKSLYARKRRYLARVGLWGFQVPEPKPWKGGNA